MSLDQVAAQLARALTSQAPATAQLRKGIVTGVGDGVTLVVQLGGVDVSGVPWLGAVLPAPGDVVWVLVQGRLVLGLGLAAGPKLQAGVVPFTLSSQGTTTVTVSYGPFASEIVAALATPRTNANIRVACAWQPNPGLSGGTIFVWVDGATPVNLSGQVHWLVIGR